MNAQSRSTKRPKPNTKVRTLFDNLPLMRHREREMCLCSNDGGCPLLWFWIRMFRSQCPQGFHVTINSYSSLAGIAPNELWVAILYGNYLLGCDHSLFIKLLVITPLYVYLMFFPPVTKITSTFPSFLHQCYRSSNRLLLLTWHTDDAH